MFILVAVVIAASVSIYSRISSRFSHLSTVLVTFIISAFSVLFFQFSLNLPYVYVALYVWIEVITTILTIQFWLLVNRAFTTREGKRLFAIIASGGSVASTIVGFSIRPFVKLFGTDYLLIFTAGFIILALVAVYKIKPFITHVSSGSEKSQFFQKEKRAQNPVRRPYLKTITLTIVISTLVASIVDYQLKIIASETLNEAEMASLFGFLFGIIGVVSVFVQFFVTGRIITNFGIIWGLMFLPVVLVTGNVMLLLSPLLISAVVSKTGDQIFRFTIHNTSNQLLWLPISSSVKERAKPFIDGTMKNSAQAVSGLLILGMIHFFDIRFLTVPALMVLVIWIAANVKLKRGYVSELQSAIEKRQLDFDSLEIDIHDPLIVSTLRKALNQGDEYQKLFALESMKDVSLTPWSNDLQSMFQEESPIIQQKILELTREEPDIIPDETILTLMESGEDTLKVEAMITCGERKLENGIPLLKKSLSSSRCRQQAAAAASLLLMGLEESCQARNLLDRMIYDPVNEIQIAALQSVGHIPEIVTDDGLKLLLEDDSLEVRRLAINLTEKRKNPGLIPLLVNNLNNPHTALSARKALKSYDPDGVVSVLMKQLNLDTTSSILAEGIIRCMSEYADYSSVDTLINRLVGSDDQVVQEIVNTLIKISRPISLSEKQVIRINEFSDGLISSLKRHQTLLSQFLSDDSAFLISDLLTTTIRKEKNLILKLTLIGFPDSPVETILHAIFSGDPVARGNVLEILDTMLPRETREKIIPLFDEKITEGEDSREEALFDWLGSQDEWTSTIALDYLLSNRMIQVLLKQSEEQSLRWTQFADSILHRETISKAYSSGDSILNQIPGFPEDLFKIKEIPMYSILEKTIFLKSVDLFRDIPGEEAAHIAQIADETHLSTDEQVFAEGDAGDSMYIIVDGKVCVHKSDKASGIEKEIAILSNGEFIGEMALLDQQPRSASATIKEDTILLRVKGEDFYDLMASRMEIMQGIVKVLTNRLREAIA